MGENVTTQFFRTFKNVEFWEKNSKFVSTSQIIETIRNFEVILVVEDAEKFSLKNKNEISLRISHVIIGSGL